MNPLCSLLLVCIVGMKYGVNLVDIENQNICFLKSQRVIGIGRKMTKKEKEVNVGVRIHKKSREI